MAARKLLVVGATGKQGGALIETLLAHKANFEIYGLTRNLTSTSATKLAQRNVKMIEGNVLQPADIFKKVGKDVWGVFSMTNPGKNEEQQAIPLIDAAIANGVHHFVFSGVDRGGPVKSNTDPTYVPHFITKYNIEKYLIEKAAESQHMTWTILRPVAFMEMFGPDFLGKLMVRVMYSIKDVRIQLVSVKDIGKAAARAFENPEQFKGKAVTLAGDSLNYTELNKIYKEELGYDAPMAPGILLTLVNWFLDDVSKMAKWFGEGGFAGSLDPIKEAYPGLTDFRTWMRTSGKWETKASGN